MFFSVTENWNTEVHRETRFYTKQCEMKEWHEKIQQSSMVGSIFLKIGNAIKALTNSLTI